MPSKSRRSTDGNLMSAGGVTAANWMNFISTEVLAGKDGDNLDKLAARSKQYILSKGPLPGVTWKSQTARTKVIILFFY